MWQSQDRFYCILIYSELYLNITLNIKPPPTHTLIMSTLLGDQKLNSNAIGFQNREYFVPQNRIHVCHKIVTWIQCGRFDSELKLPLDIVHSLGNYIVLYELGLIRGYCHFHPFGGYLQEIFPPRGWNNFLLIRQCFNSKIPPHVEDSFSDLAKGFPVHCNDDSVLKQLIL